MNGTIFVVFVFLFSEILWIAWVLMIIITLHGTWYKQARVCVRALGHDHFDMTEFQFALFCAVCAVCVSVGHLFSVFFKKNIDHILLHYFLNVRRSCPPWCGYGWFFPFARTFCSPRRVINMIITFYWFPIYCYLNNRHRQGTRASRVYTIFCKRKRSVVFSL